MSHKTAVDVWLVLFFFDSVIEFNLSPKAITMIDNDSFEKKWQQINWGKIHHIGDGQIRIFHSIMRWKASFARSIFYRFHFPPRKNRARTEKNELKINNNTANDLYENKISKWKWFRILLTHKYIGYRFYMKYFIVIFFESFCCTYTHTFAALWLSGEEKKAATTSAMCHQSVVRNTALAVIIHYNNNEMPIDSVWEQIVITNGSRE